MLHLREISETVWRAHDMARNFSDTILKKDSNSPSKIKMDQADQDDQTLKQQSEIAHAVAAVQVYTCVY